MADDEGTQISLAAAVSVDSVDRVHDLLEQLWAADPSIDDLDRMRFEMAVVEVMANIVQHTRRLDPPGTDSRRFDVTLRADGEAIVAELRDNGLPLAIDLSQVTMPDPDAEEGRGLALAISAVDDLRYERGEGRNHWELVCRRSS